jgi:hypothetical protein
MYVTRNEARASEYGDPPAVVWKPPIHKQIFKNSLKLIKLTELAAKDRGTTIWG